jgi:hypothetical protein
MSPRSRVAGLLFALACLGLFAGPAWSQAGGSAEVVRIIEMMQEVIETKDFTNQMTLKEGLQLLYEKFAARGKDLPILVDHRGFVDADADAASPYEAAVQLPPVPKQMTVGTALRVMLSQVPTKANATFIVRQGHIEIVPQSRVAIDVLLRERVLERFDKVPLQEVLDSLAATTGAPILLDVRAKDKGQERVSVVLNNLSLQDALHVLTEQAGLRYEVLQSGVFVTLPAEAKRVEKEKKKS